MEEHVALTMAETVVVYEGMGAEALDLKFMAVPKQPYQKMVRRMRLVGELDDALSTRVIAEGRSHLIDKYALGRPWQEVQEQLCIFAGQTTAQRIKRKKCHIMAHAYQGLVDLDPRYQLISRETLCANFELLYIGLVQKLIMHPAKWVAVYQHSELWLEAGFAEYELAA